MLVDYSDSDDDNVEDNPPVKKRKVDNDKAVASLPSLPSSFHSLYATNVRTANSDDPELHGGRTRQIAHQDGNWPTHVYLEWYPSVEETKLLDAAINRFQTAGRPADPSNEINPFLRSDLGVQLPLHISLSAPLVLKTHNKGAILEELRNTIAASGAIAFVASSSGITWVHNFDQIRYFLVLQLSKPANDDLNKLLRACNHCAIRHGLTELYSNTGDQGDRSEAFHISIAWSLHKPDASENGHERVKDDLALPLIEASFTEVKVKIGNVVTDIPLPGC